MRKGLLCLLIMFGLLCSGCGQTQAVQQEEVFQSGWEKVSSAEEDVWSEEEIPDAQEMQTEESNQEDMDSLLDDYLTNLEGLEIPIRQYGESSSYLLMEEDLVVRILYPMGELMGLETAMDEWILDTVAYYQEMAVGSQEDGDSSELTMDYDSYVVEGKVVGVKLKGIFERPYLAHPVDVSATFNASMESGKLLEIEDVLLPGGEEALRNMVIKQAGLEEENVDENLLNHWLLTPDGLEITLVRGEYLPMSSGTVVLLYPYQDLEGIFAMPEETQEAAQAVEAVQTGGTVQSEGESTSSEPTAQEGEAAQSEPTAQEGESTQPEQTDQEEESIPSEQVTPPTEAVDSSKPMVALTFDDGPSAHTARLLDIFASHGGKGTFFVVGNMIDGKADTVRRTAQEGHEVAGHSWNHRQLTKLSTEELKDQIMNTRAKIYEVTGVDTTLVRPPYGSYNDQVQSVAGQLGVALVNWSVDTLDWKHKNADKIYNVIMEQAKDGAIILCHDLHKTTVDAMERVIPDLIAKGYQLVTVSELLSSQGKAVSAGSMYFKR